MSQFRLSCWWIVYAFDPHQPMVEKVEFLSFSFCLLSFSQLYNKLMWQWILAIVCSCECWVFFWLFAWVPSLFPHVHFWVVFKKLSIFTLHIRYRYRFVSIAKFLFFFTRSLRCLLFYVWFVCNESPTKKIQYTFKNFFHAIENRRHKKAAQNLAFAQDCETPILEQLFVHVYISMFVFQWQ